MMKKPQVCMTIAGLDPSGGAGVVADVKAFSAFGCYAAAVITSVTFQNTTGVFGSEHQTADSVRRQAQAVIDDIGIDALKTGMLPTREIIETVANLITENELTNIVVDPVVRSTSGYDLIDDDALRSLIKNLFPLADLITPNIPETERITGIAIVSETDIIDAAGLMREMGARNVLIKGGHLVSGQWTLDSGQSEPGASATGVSRSSDVEHVGSAHVRKDSVRAIDYLFLGDELHQIEGEYHDTTATHGTGCVLSSAIAASLALGKTLKESVEMAKTFVNEAIRTAPIIGHGNSPINILAI